MKGIVFSLFNQYVESKQGMVGWEELLNTVKPKSEGIYTSGATYKDTELVDLVTAFAKTQNQKVDDVLRDFGYFMFNCFVNKYPIFFKSDMDLKAFLKSVDSVIHIEVRKLYSDSVLPELTYEEPSAQNLIINYKSPRKMCHLAEGLIQGAADHFHQSIAMQQKECMHQGNSRCRFDIRFQ